MIEIICSLTEVRKKKKNKVNTTVILRIVQYTLHVYARDLFYLFIYLIRVSRKNTGLR